jgi:4-diphosphocytidyl-2-C-methyl-D-erythritol kinase
MRRVPAPAKINLALVVGPPRPNGKHEVATVLQRVDLGDRVQLETSADGLEVTGFAGDTLVRGALEALAREAGVEPRWRATITKRIPVAAGLGGGSSDAAAALRLASETLDEPVGAQRLHALAAQLGADVPFFLNPGPQLAEGDGTQLQPLDLPQDFFVVLVLPHGARKPSTPCTSSTTAAAEQSTLPRGGPHCSNRSRASAGRATSRRCRRTTSRAHRSRTN